MAIIFILAVWMGLSTLVCLALVGAAARPMPFLTGRDTSSTRCRRMAVLLNRKTVTRRVAV